MRSSHDNLLYCSCLNIDMFCLCSQDYHKLVLNNQIRLDSRILNIKLCIMTVFTNIGAIYILKRGKGTIVTCFINANIRYKLTVFE